MKRLLLVLTVLFTGVPLLSKLRIRQRNPQWFKRHYACCADRRGQIVPYGVTNPEDAVNALREEAIKAYDSGTYLADWGKKRRAALEIQAQIGYTVSENYTFNEDEE